MRGGWGGRLVCVYIAYISLSLFLFYETRADVVSMGSPQHPIKRMYVRTWESCFRACLFYFIFLLLPFFLFSFYFSAFGSPFPRNFSLFYFESVRCTSKTKLFQTKLNKNQGGTTFVIEASRQCVGVSVRFPILVCAAAAAQEGRPRRAAASRSSASQPKVRAWLQTRSRSIALEGISNSFLLAASACAPYYSDDPVSSDVIFLLLHWFRVLCFLWGADLVLLQCWWLCFGEYLKVDFDFSRVIPQAEAIFWY